MRICIVSRSDVSIRSAQRVTARRLAAVGHEVTVVCPDGQGAIAGVTVRGVVRRKPQGGGQAGSLVRRLQPVGLRRHLLDRRLAEAASSVRPDLIYPASATDVELAHRIAQAVPGRAAVFTLPSWPTASGTDVAWLAHSDPRWATSPSGPGLSWHAPPYEPEPNRHQGKTVAVAYRRTAANPGRYVESALLRSGAKVLTFHDVLDWSAVPHDLLGVVVVESPLPALRVQGSNPGVPVAYWVHHGEHHLAANLRLAAHYGANCLLMAHSLHLAHRFSVPVHWWPFGIAPELGTHTQRWTRRRFDVAMVGSGLDSRAGRYRRRADLARQAADVAGDRAALAKGLTPDEMVDLYRDSRVVINDGGDRHLPITMRVMEAIGAGSLLLTDDLPGTDRLFRPEDHYCLLPSDSTDFGETLRTILADARSEGIAAAAHAEGLARHTYDHRVDRLIDILATTSTDQRSEWPTGDIPAWLAEYPDVETVTGLTGDLPDHVVIGGDLTDLRDDAVDAAVTDSSTVEEAARVARLFVFSSSGEVRWRAGQGGYRDWSVP